MDAGISSHPASSQLSFTSQIANGDGRLRPRMPPHRSSGVRFTSSAGNNKSVEISARTSGSNNGASSASSSSSVVAVNEYPQNVRHPNGAASGNGSLNGRGERSLAVNGRESRMVPIGEALKKEPAAKARTDTMRSANGSIPKGTVNGVANSLDSLSKTSLLSMNRSDQQVNGSLQKLPKRPLSRKLEHSLENLGWDGDAKVLPSDENFSWSKENYSTLQRTIDVWSFVLSLRTRVYLDNAKWSFIGGFSDEKQKARRRKTASWVREKILQLGPTFIKLGQLSSTRSDLFPIEFVEELSKLQDRVPAFSGDKAIAFIEKELNQPLNALFMLFEQQPIAAASLGQVHRAVLLNGEKVAVKIQRPGLKKLFDIDLSNLKKIAEYFQNNETLGGPTRDWLGIYEECATILYQEIDYINEGRNADRFRMDFRNIKWARVPQIYWDYTSHKVLTMEYVPGIKINDLARLDAGGFDRSRTAQRAIEAYLIQILKTGFFHADPHPGNLAIDVDGSMIYYDFGMMGEIKSFTRKKLLEMFYAVYEKDAKKVIQALIDLEALKPTGDMASVRRSIQFFLNNLMNQRPDEASTISAIGEDLFAIALDQPFRFPATFTFVLRAFSTLEGIGYSLDSEFSFAKVAAPYAQELLDVKSSQRNGTYFVQELQRQANEARDAAVAMPMRIQRIDDLLQQLEAGDFKLRVRVLEAERAARRASVLQTATVYAVAAGTLLNVGVSLTGQGLSPYVTPSYIGSGTPLYFIVLPPRLPCACTYV
ncbi:hypothetical protein L7F22_064380 [Adiantum nelumboides]|nr:hypothetical protein [Adiantum nelumboides]